MKWKILNLGQYSILARGVAHFVSTVSSKNHFLNGKDSFTANEKLHFVVCQQVEKKMNTESSWSRAFWTPSAQQVVPGLRALKVWTHVCQNLAKIWLTSPFKLFQSQACAPPCRVEAGQQHARLGNTPPWGEPHAHLWFQPPNHNFTGLVGNAKFTIYTFTIYTIYTL